MEHMAQPPTFQSGQQWYYRCAPLAASLSTGKMLDAGAAATQLEELINSWAETGWEFYRADEFTIMNQPGCFASLFGGKPTAMNQIVVTFRCPA